MAISTRTDEAVAPQQRSRGRLEYVDGMRGLAALYVMLHHAWLTVWPLGSAPTGLARAATGWLKYGHFAVSVFIVLSGFCLMLPALRGGGTLPRGTADFYRRRARRILPPYYAAMALSLLLIVTLVGRPTGTHWDVSLPVRWRDIWSHALLVHDAVGSNRINHVFWSIAVECQIYLWFPLMLVSWRTIGPRATVALTVVAGLSVGLAGQGTFVSDMHPEYYGLFAIGMLAAYACRGRSRRPGAGDLMLALVAAGTVLACIVGARWLRAGILSVLLCEVLVGALTYAAFVAASSAAVGRVLGWRPLAALGAFSYSLYLIHAPLLQVVWQYALRPLRLGPLATFALLAIGGGALIVLAAYGFYLAFERPFVGGTAPAARAVVEAKAGSAP